MDFQEMADILNKKGPDFKKDNESLIEEKIKSLEEGGVPDDKRPL